MLTPGQVNIEIGKNSGYARAKGFTVEWNDRGIAHLYRTDCVIVYKRGLWQVIPIIDKALQDKPASKHRMLLLALKSVH